MDYLYKKKPLNFRVDRILDGWRAAILDFRYDILHADRMQYGGAT